MAEQNSVVSQLVAAYLSFTGFLLMYCSLHKNTKNCSDHLTNKLMYFSSFFMARYQGITQVKALLCDAAVTGFTVT